MSFWDTPAGREGLAARSMERAPLHQAMRAAEPCGNCGRLTDDLRPIDFGKRRGIWLVCGTCVEKWSDAT